MMKVVCYMIENKVVTKENKKEMLFTMEKYTSFKFADMQNRLKHVENYGPYAGIIEFKKIPINVSSITKSNWQSHYDSVLNLLKDGIETECVQKGFISVTFTNKFTLDLSVTDYLLNLIMWNMLIRVDIPIMPMHVFFANEIKKDTIKDYIDRFLIDTSRKNFTNKELNNIIDDTLFRFHDIDSFAMFLSNTVNLEDNIFLMRQCDEFNNCMHADLSGVPLEDVKSVGMEYANRAISIMKDASQYLGYDHCLADACRASEGINPKQFKEFTINIGTKPNGRGGIFERPIMNSFINGGVASPIDYFIESSTGRTAQIIKYQNVGSSGHFARILGLNNMDSSLYPDPNYDCYSRNFVKITIKDKKTLKMLKNRYYRLYPNGIEYVIKSSDTNLIGKEIYLRSPVTCASAARGQGICYKCYGDLAYTVYDAGIRFGVNVGRIASENLSSSLTQKLLSAKHLLETFIEKISWSDKFNELFEIEGNLVHLNPEPDPKLYKMIISPEAIELENEEDDDLVVSDDDENSTALYNEFIREFDVSDGENIYHITSDKGAKLYISNELNSIIRRKGEPIDGKIFIDFIELKSGNLFIIPIENNELSKTLDRLKDLLDKNSTIALYNIHTLLQALIDTAIEGGLNIASTHLEVILSNQIRDADNILERARWYELNPNYEILSLNKSLTCNPSVTISMSYQKVSRLLYNPLTFKKNGSSFMDLFFMERPQCAIRDIDESKLNNSRTDSGLINPVTFFENPDKVTTMGGIESDDD